MENAYKIKTLEEQGTNFLEVVSPQQYIINGATSPLNAAAAAIWEQALAKASNTLTNLLSDPNREALFADVFGRAGTDPPTFAANLLDLLANLGGGGLQIAVDLRSDGELGGALAAYAAIGHTGLERIYVNADKLNNGQLDVNLATSALLEEFGHALDWRLNGDANSSGDEGQLFAAEVTGVKLTTDQRTAITSVNDHTTLTIEGVQVLVKLASTPQVSVTSIANGNEANGNPAVFRFSRTGSTTDALAVSYRLLGTAQAGSDYNGATSGTINFSAGSATAELSLPALADSVIDPGETIMAQIVLSRTARYVITPGQQTATATITAEGMVVTVRGPSRPGRSEGEVRNDGAFTALKNDGTVVGWGNSSGGGTAPTGLSGVTQIFSTNNAFTALKNDGTVVAWGDSSEGGTAPTGLSGVTQIFSNPLAFAALKNDGTVVAWGSSTLGGTAPTGLSGVVGFANPFTNDRLLLPPTTTITDSDLDTVNITDGAVTFTFTFTEAVTGFDTSKVTVGNGSKGSFSGSGTTYALVVTPTAASTGNIIVDVSTTGVIDATGNQATPPAQYTQAFDTAAPELTSGAAATAIIENSRGGQIIYIANTENNSDVTFSLKTGVGDASSFSIDASTGAVTINPSPN